jgi:hypothetical protein|tara:strand:+ start:631 stop:1089 length:459 start_codon:yes stop_codon:yes gene_type:complete
MFKFLSDREKLIFLSGIFEGEGCFGHFKNGKKPKRIEIQLQMTDPDVVNKFYDYFKKGHLSKKEYTNHYKTLYRWKVTGLEALKILHKMLPYFCKRRKENYYGMVQSIRNGSKDGSAYILEPSKDKTSDVGCTTNACTEDGSRGGSLSRQAS